MNHAFKIRWLIEANHEAAKRVIQTFAYLSFSDAFGLTLLHYSAESNNKEIAEFLLEKGCDVNAKDKWGKIPLISAVTNNCEEIAKMLLEAGSDINIKHCGGESALSIGFSPRCRVSISIQKLFLKTVNQQFLTSEDKAKCLIKAGCRLYQAIYLKDSVIVECMLLCGSRVDLKSATDNKTALHLAVELDDMKSAMLLLKHGADAKALDNKGSTPLNYLYSDSLETTQEKLDVLLILLNSGVNFADCTLSGAFQLGPTLEKGSVEAIRTILTHPKLDFAIKDFYDTTILHYLARNNDPGIIEELKFHRDKFDFNALDAGVTPLVDALTERNVQMAKFLLENGADANYEVHLKPTMSLIYFVCMYSNLVPKLNIQYDRCFELLLQYKADPEFVVLERDGSTTIIFDLPLDNGKISKIKAAIAHVAMLEALGRPITKRALSSINSQRPLKKYLKRCRRVLKRKVTCSLKVLNLLTDSKQKMARYINDELIQKLERLCTKNKVKLDFPYYCNAVKTRYWEAKEYQQATAAICNIFEDRIHENHLVTCVIMNYLDLWSRRALSQYSQLYQ